MSINYASNRTVVILLIIIICSNVAWGYSSFITNNELSSAREQLAHIEQNKRVLYFQKLFVDKVLKSNGVVDFNTRVELQNAATATENEAVISAWERFLSAKTESEGQARVKDLISTLAGGVYDN